MWCCRAPASGQRARAVADHGPLTKAGGRDADGGAGAWWGCERAGSAPALPHSRPKACVRAGGHLAPRSVVSTEPSRAARGHRAKGWVDPAGAVAISRR